MQFHTELEVNQFLNNLFEEKVIFNTDLHNKLEHGEHWSLVFQTSNHLILFWSTLLFGAMIMLICDSISQLPTSEYTLPINAITSLFGAPIIIWLLVRKRKIYY